MSASPPTPLSQRELHEALALRDLTDPAQGRHAIQLLAADLVSALCTTWSSQQRVVRRDPLVSLADNYDNLGYASDAVTRDARYTRYVDGEHVLRSHSSAMIPPSLRELAHDERAGLAPDDVLLACIGVCYRRDSVDWQHTGTPHQIDLWRIRRDRPCTEADLQEMIATVVTSALPGRQWRTVATGHPYTLAGRQIDVRHGDQWVEVGECGLAAPAVLARAGLDPARWSGLAMGPGLDRLLMLRKGVPDIRLLRSSDRRVAEQMLDLAPYRPVSHMPPVRRDLSLAVAATTDVSAEALGDRVRRVLGHDAETVETVDVRNVTAYDQLPTAARERLGILPGQRNVLVRLVLRSLDRSLTDEEANEIRDRVYGELHEGEVHQWALGQPA